MIPVIVRQQQRDRPGRLGHPWTDADDAGPGVEQEHRAGALVGDLDARRIAAMADAARAPPTAPTLSTPLKRTRIRRG